MALITQADVEARLQRALTAEEVTAFTIINSALQAYVEQQIGSSVESASQTTRYYDGGWQHLKIDPCTTVTSVKLVDDDDVVVDTYDSSDYSVEPKNKTLKTMLRHRVSSGFVVGINNIAVAAKFSIYADTDSLNIIKDALIGALVAEIGNNNGITREAIEGYSVEYASAETKTNLDRISYLFPEV